MVAITAVVTGRMMCKYMCESFQNIKEPSEPGQWICACNVQVDFCHHFLQYRLPLRWVPWAGKAVLDPRKPQISWLTCLSVASLYFWQTPIWDAQIFAQWLNEARRCEQAGRSHGFSVTTWILEGFEGGEGMPPWHVSPWISRDS